MPQTASVFQISTNKKMGFFLMFQGPLKQKNWFLALKMCPVARGQPNKQTYLQTDTKVTTEDILSGLRISFLQPSIKERYSKRIVLL